MYAKGRPTAFTLIEVLIVVIIMALLAATIIPQFSSSTTDAKKSSSNFNVHTMNSLIEMYKAQHNGKTPELAKFTDQLTKRTDINGATAGADTDLIYGPYFHGPIPTNPFTGTNTIVAVADQSQEPAAAIGNAGWQYNENTGVIYPNNAEYFQNP